jgi:hypothetical protein
MSEESKQPAPAEPKPAAPAEAKLPPQVEAVVKAQRFIGGLFMDSSALPVFPGVELTVDRIEQREVENPRTREKKQHYVLVFSELPDFGFLLSAKINRKKIRARLGEGAAVRGKKISVYLDPEVKYGAKVTGGIRIK